MKCEIKYGAHISHPRHREPSVAIQKDNAL